MSTRSRAGDPAHWSQTDSARTQVVSARAAEDGPCRRWTAERVARARKLTMRTRRTSGRMNNTAARESTAEARSLMPVADTAPIPTEHERQRLQERQLGRYAHQSPDPVPTPAVRDPDRAGDHPGYDPIKLVPLDVNDAALSSTDDHGNDVAVGELEAAEGLWRPRLRVVRQTVIHQLPHSKRQPGGQDRQSPPGRGGPRSPVKAGRGNGHRVLR